MIFAALALKTLALRKSSQIALTRTPSLAIQRLASSPSISSQTCPRLFKIRP
ncbi:hypothetical protein ACOJBM_42010 [Rhizobium beringeri]